MKFKFSFIKFLLTVFFIFAVCVGIYQLYSFLYKSVSTEYAVQISCEDTVKVTGYFVRNEMQISNGGAKYIDITVNNGDKVSRLGTIANVYSSESSAKVQADIRALQTKINDLTSIVSSSSNFKENISYLSSIRRQMLGISTGIQSDSISEAFDSASELITDIIKSKILSGEITDYSEKLDALKSEMNLLKSDSSSIVNRITSQKSGYFLNNADGLEDKLNIKMTESITDQKYQSIKSICEEEKHVTNGIIGKVVEGSDWRVCFEASEADFEKLSVGSVVYIRIPSVTDSKIKCNVVSVSKEDKNVYVVLESNMVTGNIISQRTCDIDVIINSYDGIRVDKNALRKIDGENGVFIRSNGILKYKKVNILYIGSTYAVIEYDPLDSSGVQIFDEVVTKGSDLKSGKVVS